MIVLIGGEKGGAGKSTIACNLAAYLSLLNKDVLLLDTDPQKTSSSWLYRRSLIKENLINSAEKSGDIYKTLLDLGQRYEYVIVDTGGRDSTELRSGLIVADVIYTPIKPSQIDIDTLAKMDELVGQARSINKKLVAYTIITHAPTNPHMDDKKETEKILSAMPEFILSNVSLAYRSSYWRTMGQGLSVIEYTDDKAKTEVLALGASVFGL